MTYLAKNFEDFSTTESNNNTYFFNVLSTFPIVPSKLASNNVHLNTVTLITKRTQKIQITSTFTLSFLLLRQHDETLIKKEPLIMEFGNHKIEWKCLNMIHIFGVDLVVSKNTSSFIEIQIHGNDLKLQCNTQNAVTTTLNLVVSQQVVDIKVNPTYLSYGVLSTSSSSSQATLLLPSRSICSSYDFSICGSTVPCMKWSYSKPTFYASLRRRLCFKKPNVKDVVGHLIFLCEERRGTYRDLDRVYSALNDTLAYASDESDIKDLLHEKRILLLADRKSLVAPRSVFSFLSEDVRPYAIDRADLSTILRTKSHFLRAVGAGERVPSVVEIVRFSFSLSLSLYTHTHTHNA